LFTISTPDLLASGWAWEVKRKDTAESFTHSGK
jgi:hypothetical protein